MAAELTAAGISRPPVWRGITLVLSGTAGLVALAASWYGWQDPWPPRLFRLCVLAAAGVLLWGLGELTWRLLPAPWWRPLHDFGRRRVHIPLRIPREGVGYLIIMVVCFVGASMTHSNPLMLVFAAMAGPFVVTGSVTYAMLKNMRVERHVPPRAMVGELFSVELLLRNQSRWLSAWLLTAEDEVRHPQTVLQASVLFTRLGRQSESSGHYHVRLPVRGRYRFGPLRVLSRYPLGLVERSRLFRETDETLVYPRIGRLTPQWKRRLLGATELVDSAQPRDGVFDDEFHHLREYRWGDNPRAIHWRSSARRNELIVREYQPNREHDLLVLIDLYAPEAAGHEDRQRVERALSLAATLCWEHRRMSRGARLCVALAGHETWRFEASTALAGWEPLLDRLAVAEPAAQADFAGLLARELASLDPQTRSVVITTRNNPQLAGGQTAQVLLTDAASFADMLTFEDPYALRGAPPEHGASPSDGRVVVSPSAEHGSARPASP